jgi:prepilin-type N-terminal cleavage/methylation domain-containing protein/prepilin-type processing-associated H-X9-DG protein
MKRRGFTLVELLVVIGVIAILIAILLPSLSRAKQQARTAVCLSNEHSLGHTYTVYLAEWGIPNLRSHAYAGGAASNLLANGTSWPYRLTDPTASAGSAADSNFGVKQGLANQGDKMRFCPEALAPNPSGTTIGAAHFSWLAPEGAGTVGGLVGGSYAINQWLDDVKGTWMWAGAGNFVAGPRFAGGDTKQSGSRVPLFVDCISSFIVASEFDEAAADLENPTGPFANVGTTLFGAAIDRHRMAVNVVFLDGHAETVKLPNLWTLRWADDWSRTTPGVVPGTIK